MYDGYFLESFFARAGELGSPNTQGEYAVHCPFEHDKGYDTNPSAHINLDKAVFHCKTCRAEGRFKDGGLSETAFISEYYKISYHEAIQWKKRVVEGGVPEDMEQSVKNLWTSETYLSMLRDKRGFTDSTIKKYQLGFTGDGVEYPVFIFGTLCDIRTYSPDSKPKIKSKKGATTLLFPFDHWINDDRPTILVGGENDALLCRQLGFNGLTFTGGEGSVPSRMFINMFSGKKVYICYDCDNAGKKGSLMVAYKLREAGADVYLMDLGLPGTKEDKDLTDYIVKDGRTRDDFLNVMKSAVQLTDQQYHEEKNKEYPIVNLWETTEGKNHGRRMSSRVVMIGKYDMDMYVPTAVSFTCGFRSQDKDKLEAHRDLCPIHRWGEGKDDNKEIMWTLHDDNMKDALHLAELSDERMREVLFGLARIPASGCKFVKHKILSRAGMQKVIFAPDVETESELGGYRAVEQYAYVLDHRLNDGNKYRIYHRAFAHPNDRQRAFLVVDMVEESDNAVNTFKMTEDLKDKLSVFQGPPDEMMRRRAEMAKGIVGGFTTDMMVWGADLVYHGPLRFKYLGKDMKGYPEIAIIGESRTGKTDTAVSLQNFYRLGNRVSLKNASVAGLMGGADKLPNGAYQIKWGVIPRNDKGLMILDEMSGANPEVVAALTDMRSSGEAMATKIVSAKAPARTRLLWIGNPRVIEGKSKSLLEYPTGVAAVLDLVGADEDVARFDAVMLVVDRGIFVRPDERGDYSPHDPEAYRNLIRWIWSRSTDQIIFSEAVEDYIISRSKILNESYAADVKLLGPEAYKKLARFAVSCAACCFSCDSTGENLIVKKEHVDWAEMFLNRCYDDDVFRLKEYVLEQRKYVTINPEIEAVVAGLMRVDSSALVIRELIGNTETIPRSNLEAMSGMLRDEFSKMLNYLSRHHLVYNRPKGILATRRLRLSARKAANYRLTPLSERV